ncbi:MAG: hypothetical protein WCL16_06920 [bacterium]
MSLIEEALRKHREEQAAQKQPVQEYPDTSSTPASPHVSPEVREPSRRRMLILAGFALLLVVVVLTAIVLGSQYLLKHAGRPQAELQIGPGSSVAFNGATTKVAGITAPAAPQRTSNALALLSTANPLSKITLSNGPAIAGAAGGATAPASTLQPTSQVTAAATATPFTPPQPIRPAWPQLSVSGIMSAPGNRSTAIVNGKLLRQGEKVQDVLITGITKHGVSFEFAGETRLIRTGSTSD